MNARVLESRSRFNAEPGSEVLDVLAQSDTPALATDIGGHVVFWNRAAERLLGRPTNQVLGRRCYDVLGGRGRVRQPLLPRELLRAVDVAQGRGRCRASRSC